MDWKERPPLFNSSFFSIPIWLRLHQTLCNPNKFPVFSLYYSSVSFPPPFIETAEGRLTHTFLPSGCNGTTVLELGVRTKEKWNLWTLPGSACAMGSQASLTFVSNPFPAPTLKTTSYLGSGRSGMWSIRTSCRIWNLQRCCRDLTLLNRDTG